MKRKINEKVLIDWLVEKCLKSINCWSLHQLKPVQIDKNSSKVLNLPSKKRIRSKRYREVLKFYHRHDVSTALPGKKDVKSVKKRKPVRIQKRNLNDYLSNFYEKLKTEKTHLKLSFSNFTRMRPAYFMLANFCSRHSCLCTQHQNLALKFKIIKGHNKSVPSNPDVIGKDFLFGFWEVPNHAPKLEF